MVAISAPTRALHKEKVVRLGNVLEAGAITWGAKAGSWFELHGAPARAGLSPLPHDFLITSLCCPREEGVDIPSVALCSQICKVLSLWKGKNKIILCFEQIGKPFSTQLLVKAT